MAKSRKEGRGLFGDKIEFKIGSSASSFRSSSGGVRAPPPPSPSSPRRPPLPPSQLPPLPPSQLPPPAPAPRIPVAELSWPKGSPPQQQPQLWTLAPAASTSDRAALTATGVDALGTPPAPAPPGIQLISQSRPKCSPPQSQPAALPQAPPALPSDCAAPTTTDVKTEGVSGLHYGIAPESSVSLKFLAGAGKRTYPGPPRNHCAECPSAFPRNSGPQDGAAAGQKSKRHCCRIAQSINCTVKQSEKRNLTKEVGTPPAPAPPGIQLVSQSRPKCSPPQSQPAALPQAPPALPSDCAAPTTTDVKTEGVSGLHYKGGNECEEVAELETSSKHQDTYGITPESSASLEFLAGAGKRTYPGPPRNHCVECPSALPRKSGPQDGAAAGQKSKRSCCRLAQGINCTVKQFVEKQILTKEVEIPGTSRDCRISTVSRMSTRLFLRRMIKALYKLHRSGKCLGGSFSLTNFLIDDEMFIYLDYNEDSLEGHSKDGANRDFKQFVRTVKDEVFAFEETPQEISAWLKLIERDGRAYEYLISYHSSLMEYHQTLNTFYALYHKLLLMQIRDHAGYIFVLDQLQVFDGWKEHDLHNEFFIETCVGRRNPSTHRQADYDTDLMSLLRLIRNTFQHITLKTMDSNGNVTFGPEEFEYILHDQFPGLLPELMEAMYIAGYLSDLNLEYQMC